MAKKILKNIGVFLTALGALTNNVMAADDDPIGTIPLPSHLPGSVEGGEGTGGGLIGLISSIVKILMVVAGIWSFFNVLLAGFTYVTSGDKPDEIKKAGEKIYMSLIGLVIVVGSFVIAALVGWVLYGDSSAILQPTIYGPGE